MPQTDVKRWTENLKHEREGEALYRALAEAEKDPKLSEVYTRLAKVEHAHSERWRRKLEDAGVEVPPIRVSWRARMLMALARRFGVAAVLPTVIQFEQTDSRDYIHQGDARDLVSDDQSHARVLRHISRTMPGGLDGGQVARMESRHRGAGGNALRAAVLGGNDGLVSNLSLIMGVAGAALSREQIIVTGIAGLMAGACSMALGEWLSVQSSRELYERQIAMEKEEIEEAPEEEAEELSLIYQARGLPEKLARTMATEIMSDPENALQTLAREELGIDPKELGGSPWVAAGTSFVLFSLGAIMPLIPFFFLGGRSAVIASAIFSAIGLFTIGAAITLFTGRSALMSGLRQVAFGLTAALLTFFIGRLIGVGLAS